MKSHLSTGSYLNHLEKQVEEIIAFYGKGYDFSITVYDEWTAKDVPGYVVAWHESFARKV